MAILDIDYHHGNGQQEIFYNRADVLTVSIHGHPSFAYPYFSGFRDETGTGAGAGYNLNIPLPEHITPEQHRNAVAEGLRRIRRFNPAFLVLSLGFDTGRGDPTGTWPNRAKDFEQLGRMVGEQGYSTLVVQEGGYRVRTLGANARSFFNGLVTGHASARQMAPSLNRGAGLARAGQHRNGLEWRSAVMADDVGRVRSLVASTGFFNPAEVEVAADLVTERLTKGIRSGYNFVLAERGSSLVGYACYGPIEGTQGSFELYWIAVSPDEQRRGLGAQAYARAEAAMRKAGAKHIYADTSSSDRYAGTRGFYQRMGFHEDARLADFYAPGRRQDRLCETAWWGDRTAVVIPAKAGIQGPRLGLSSDSVMPGLVPGIHDFQPRFKSWMAGTSPAMTKFRLGRLQESRGRSSSRYLRKAQRRLRKAIPRTRQAAGAAAGDRHHMQVEHDRRGVVGGALGQQPLDDGEPGPLRHGSAAIAQDRARRVVAPLLQHAVQQIEIGLNRDRGEDIAGNEFHAPGDPKRLEEGPRGLDGVRAVEQHRFEPRMGAEQGGEQPAIAAADIGEALRAR